jgi:fluoroacetyl-CoA thioesterase
MKETLKPGLKHKFTYVVPEEKTVPHLYRESAEMGGMPAVFATAFMIGLMEWTCIQAIEAHLDDGEGSLGIAVDVSHVAATPAGLPVTVEVEVVEVAGRRVSFHVRAHDGVDLIGEGRHSRAVVEWARFERRVSAKAAKYHGARAADAQAAEVSHG